MSVTTNKKGNRVEYHYWDYSFEWTDKHRPGSELNPWIRTCDILADEANAVLDGLPSPENDPTVIWLGLPRQGIYLTPQEEEDYIAVWRLVAFYMGAPTKPFTSAAKAKIVSESLLVNKFEPTKTGRILARNIAIGLENTAPIYALLEYMDALTRLLNGDQLSNKLHIPKTGIYHKLLMWGYCFWVQVQAKTLPIFPGVDRYLIEKHLMDPNKGLGKETVFDFKYIPTLKWRTILGDGNRYFFKKPGVKILSYFGLLTAFSMAAGAGAGVYFVLGRFFPERDALHGFGCMAGVDFGFPENYEMNDSENYGTFVTLVPGQVYETTFSVFQPDRESPDEDNTGPAGDVFRLQYLGGALGWWDFGRREEHRGTVVTFSPLGDVVGSKGGTERPELKLQPSNVLEATWCKS
ncbi:oxygenase MpaB family protein [Aspergillus stella-maris]|uniref:oxygenase MpaB family protein n=1 Tax=Aspergillus stella-maris TaxID=1810926 RepID=UPI003CCCA364